MYNVTVTTILILHLIKHVKVKNFLITRAMQTNILMIFYFLRCMFVKCLRNLHYSLSTPLFVLAFKLVCKFIQQLFGRITPRCHLTTVLLRLSYLFLCNRNHYVIIVLLIDFQNELVKINTFCLKHKLTYILMLNQYSNIVMRLKRILKLIMTFWTIFARLTNLQKLF